MKEYKVALEAGYHKEDLEINNLGSNIKIDVEGKEFFMTLFLFQNDRQICQITTNKATSRIITKDPSKTSRACQALETTGTLTLEYALYSFNKHNKVNLIIKEACEQMILSYEGEVDIYQDLTLKDQPSWYSGDFHTHTIYSDGKLTREENLVMANSRDLDFFAPTEHNVFHQTWPDSNIIIIPGMEFTSNLGHFNILFSEVSTLEAGELGEFVSEEDFKKLLDKYSHSGIISLNHPFLAPWDLKMGSYELDKIKTMEIINDPTYWANTEATEKALKAWSIMLNDGYKIVGVGGSDSHNIPSEVYEGSIYPSLIGDPKTWIYAKSLSKKDLKEALLAGKVCVSREDLIDLREDEAGFSVDIYRKTYHRSKLKIQWLVDGKIARETKSSTDRFDYKPKDGYSWIRVDVRDEDGLLYGFTNPIFFNEDKRESYKLFTWQDILGQIDD